MTRTKDSKELLKYLNTNFKGNEYNTKKNSKKIFREIYDNIVEGTIFVQNEKKRLKKRGFYNVDYDIIETESDIPFPTKFTYNAFPSEIRNHINERAFSKLKYTFNLFQRKINIIFVSEENLQSKIPTYNHYVDNMLSWLYIVNEYSSSRCNRQITIYIYLTTHKKELPQTQMEVLDQIHVNTAFTYPCRGESEIVLFRREEWFKCFIHETFHSFGLDFCDSVNNICENEIKQIFGVNTQVNLFESYTEFWARIINTAFCCYNSLQDKYFDEFFDLFPVMFNYEIKFSFIQLIKVLDHMGLTYRSLYTADEYSVASRSTLYKEKSSILAYYVITTVLMNNYTSFLMWCSKNNLNLFQFKKTPTNEKAFCSFIRRNYKTKHFLDNLDKTYKILHDKKKQIPTLCYKTLRMTVIENI